MSFADGSSEAPTSWLWDFGDGNTSTLQNPTHTYTTPGAYTVTLTATNANGSSTPLAKSDIIGVTSTTGGSPYWHEDNDFAKPFKSPTAAESALAAEVLALFNQERAAVGKPALVYDVEAERAAKAHAEDMQHRNYFAHNAPEGWTPGDRLTMTGATGFSGPTENIASGMQDAASVVTAWMNSQGHRDNILGNNVNSTHVGLGLAPHPSGSGFLWVAKFIRRP